MFIGRTPHIDPMQRHRTLVTRRRGIAAVLFAACMLPAAPPVAAETLFVTDRLEVGLHDARDRTSVISKLLPSATELEVLERDGGFIKVRTPDDAEGWVDAAYLTADLPAQQQVDELERWKKTREEELKAAWSEVETLRAQLAAEAGEETAPADDQPREEYLKAVDQIARLESENAALRDLLEQQARQPEPAPPQPRPASWTVAGWELNPADLPLKAGLIGALVLFLGGLFAGLWVMDRLNRRRHGGFRV